MSKWQTDKNIGGYQAIGGFDGTEFQVLRLNTDGSQVMGGGVADGSAVSGAPSPVLIAGQDGTNVQSILTDTTGALFATSNNVFLTATPAVTAGAYTTGQCVGALNSLSGAARLNAGSGFIQSVMVTVKTALTAPYDVLFFSTNPTNSTFTDNGALAVNVADLQSLCGIAHCTDVVALTTPTALQATNLAIPFKLSASATILYAQIVIRGAQTYATTSAIGLNVNILQN